MLTKKRKGIAICITLALILGTMFSFSALAYAQEDPELNSSESTVAATEEATAVASTEAETTATAASTLATQSSLIKAAATNGPMDITAAGNDKGELSGDSNNNNRPHKFEKLWVGDSEEDRPDSITIRVTRTDEDGSNVRTTDIILTADGSKGAKAWEYKTNPNDNFFADKYGDGNKFKYQYTYEEILPTDSNYTAGVPVVKHGNSGLVEVTITNTYVPPTTTENTDESTSETQYESSSSGSSSHHTIITGEGNVTTGPSDESSSQSESIDESSSESKFDESSSQDESIDESSSEDESIDESSSESKFDGSSSNNESIDESKEDNKYGPSDIGTDKVLTADNDNAPQTGDDGTMNLFLILIIMAGIAALISIAPTIKQQLNK